MSEDILSELAYDWLQTEPGWITIDRPTIDRAAAEIERLREQLHLANIDAVGAHAEANELRKHLIKAVALIIRLIDTRRCSASDLRALNAARAALEAKP
jgi:hypothetical protein